MRKWNALLILVFALCFASIVYGQTGVTNDLVDIQEKLTEVQSQLDSETAQRKILANETEKAAVDVTFEVEKSRRNRSVWTPIGDALRESGTDLAVSTAWLISAIVTIIAWLVVIIPLCWLLSKLWRRFRQRSRSTPS